MRMIVGAVALMIVVVVAGVAFERIMAAEAERILHALRDVEKAILDNRFEEALVLLSHVEERWDRVGRTWPIVVDHHDIDHVSETLIRLRQYMRFGDVENSVVELSAAAMPLAKLQVRNRSALRLFFDRRLVDGVATCEYNGR